jgi:hypothetical protein
MPTIDALSDSALDDALLSVWRQTLIEQKKIVSVGESTFAVRRTSKNRLAQVDFELRGLQFRGLEQIRRPLHAGQKWRAKAPGLCNSCGRAATWA